MAVANKANNFHAFLDGAPEPLKVTHQGGHVKGSLLYTNAEIEMLFQLMEKCLPVGTQEWEQDETQFTSTHFRPLQDATSL
jgi:hypothetical protein